MLGGQSADMSGVFDAAIDGEADRTIEFVVQHLVTVCDPQRSGNQFFDNLVYEVLTNSGLF